MSPKEECPGNKQSWMSWETWNRKSIRDNPKLESWRRVINKLPSWVKKTDKSRLEVGCKPFSQSWVDWINCIVERFRIQEFSNGYRKVDYQILKPSTVHWLNGVIIKKITLKISTACSLSEYKQLRKVKTQAVEFTRRSSVSGVNVHKNRGNSSEIFSLLMIMDG